MRHGSRPFAALILAPALALAGSPLLAASSTGTTVTITVTDLRNTKGVVRACMTDDANIFPKCRQDPKSHRATVNAAGTVTITFENVAPGTYAIALLHDENNNGKADRALMMMPKEGYGFSRDAKVKMGPPSFKSAAFEVADKPLSQTIRMRYML
ncbi:hypothetical protein SZ64_14135 [Erythrobacter sp. SG61-1L]|uniref:DUF2141 domain-containing protein n=1 Tax=Erythrobacter sp. SG61-1L TaxID=1603897 RepID=UPI0006D6E060|nr:DUF2141 domain-containing protein [Erythrobacter sp. SG61-1L]KPL69146.1 hypothetical protein SZ64_14135 [Erythrobacter sp. SG61-1L]